MKRYLLYMLLFLTWSLIACDDGKIYDETVIVTGEGRTDRLPESKAGRRNIALSLPDSETENLQLLQNRYRHRLPMVKSLK